MYPTSARGCAASGPSNFLCYCVQSCLLAWIHARHKHCLHWLRWRDDAGERRHEAGNAVGGPRPAEERRLVFHRPVRRPDIRFSHLAWIEVEAVGPQARGPTAVRQDDVRTFGIDVEDARPATVVAPLQAGADRYRDEFMHSAQHNLPLGIPGFKPLGRHWPLDGAVHCGSVSYPLPGAPVFIEGGVRWRYLNKISGMGFTSATYAATGGGDTSEREGQLFTSKTSEYAFGLSVGVKFFKFQASLKGSTTLNSFSIRDVNSMDNLYKQAMWPMLKARLLRSPDKMAMLSSRATEMIDALRRVAPKSDTAATRSEIKAGWLHQLLHRADKEIAEVGFEAVPPLLQLRRLARNLDGVPGDKDIPPPEEPVTHNGYPLRVMKVSDYGRFKGTSDFVLDLLC